ncbi:energy transducer TonB [Phenylobacterium sp.]|uniref:energy transducer TonB family protein n=1 Tax=Phenylobacterium sp. TaxID=1871053 RepID=UPI0025FA58FA|nr:energy transducer TonB [Phenylobacterium sp.]
MAATAGAQDTASPPEPAQATREAARLNKAEAPQVEKAKVLRTPTDAETEMLYPPDALRHAKMGRAVITCQIAPSTQLEKCVIASEDPPGFGFGAALMQAAKFYRVQPPTVDGTPVAGAKITIPMSFQLSLDKAAEQIDHRQAAATARADAPPETEAQRTARLGPLRRSDKVLWAPVSYAALTILGLAWAVFWPQQRRRKRRANGQWA